MADISVADFIFDLPLYTPIINEGDNSLDKYIRASGKVEGYSLSLKQDTTYSLEWSKLDNVRHYSSDIKLFVGYNKIEATCLRTNEKMLIILLLTLEDKRYVLRKIGQYPTIADIHISKVKDYHKVLDKAKIREFTRAIGLAANGVGIGSFVYLRRIFEHLLEEAHIKAKSENEWNEEEYNKARVDNKIGLLKNYLPNFLVEHKVIYGILSKGIHELTEEECLSYFEPIKAGIEQILDEKYDVYLKEEKLNKAKQAIQAISQRFGS